MMEATGKISSEERQVGENIWAEEYASSEDEPDQSLQAVNQTAAAPASTKNAQGEYVNPHCAAELAAEVRAWEQMVGTGRRVLDDRIPSRSIAQLNKKEKQAQMEKYWHRNQTAAAPPAQPPIVVGTGRRVLDDRIPSRSIAQLSKKEKQAQMNKMIRSKLRYVKKPEARTSL